MRAQRSPVADTPLVIPSEARDLGSSFDRRWVCQKSFWLRGLILGAILSLALNVATRYSTITRQEAGTTKSATSQSLDGQRQNLLNDGLQWSAPAAKFVLFEPARLSVAVLSSIPPVARVYSEVSLYDRPPPYC
jgi:hypothetical protein